MQAKLIARRTVLAGLSGLAACAVPLPGGGRRYTDRPEMMAIGDSLYQGVRSFSFKPGLAQLSPPAQVARALQVDFTIPDPEREFLFDLEHFFFSPVPLAFELLLYLVNSVNRNALEWLNQKGGWSRHEAFDNISIGGAGIDNLWGDSFAKHWPIFERNVRTPNYQDFSVLFETWYALVSAYTLNPRARDEQAGKTPLQQVIDRRPRTLLVNIGSNEGLVNGCFLGSVAKGEASLTASLANMTELARRLGELPRAVERVVFNSLLRPRVVPNMMPAASALGRRPGDGYYDAYGPWLFEDDQPITGRVLAEFDRQVLGYNGEVRSLMERALGPRLVYVDLYTASNAFDGKHYDGRGVSAGSQLFTNLPLTRAGSVRSGGITGLDNLHPTGVGYGALSQSVLQAMGSPASVDLTADLQNDDLLARVPALVDGRNEEIRRLYALVTNIGQQGIAAAPPDRAARTQGLSGSPS
jgi:hypothetical protein